MVGSKRGCVQLRQHPLYKPGACLARFTVEQEGLAALQVISAPPSHNVHAKCQQDVNRNQDSIRIATCIGLPQACDAESATSAL
eukprot:6463003-Amphidinium_carterae.4